MNPIAVAVRAKGPSAVLKRGHSIVSRYGFTSAKMDHALRLFAYILEKYGCGATFPITATTLRRNSAIINKYIGENIEFAVHGYTHVDYSRLEPEEQLAHLRCAREIFSKAGVQAVGFRSPYLSRNSHLDSALEAAGYVYVSNQPVWWDVLDIGALAPVTHAAYERAVGFYRPWLASERLSLPRLHNQLIEIPVSLPDDEILLDRLDVERRNLVDEAWHRILAKTYERGELFTIQLHPERTELCASGLASVLAEARQLKPPVWLARLDEIASWWRARTEAAVQIRAGEDGTWEVSVTGPPGTTILARGVEILGPAKPWADAWSQVTASSCVVRAASQPLIGLSPACPQRLESFLRQQGYLCQVAEHFQTYSFYVDRATFTPADERPLLDEIKKDARQLVRLGRWPNSARSALCVSGDIDALTIWDYGLRALGR